ncbi:hypothetical protein SBOR_3101 [Sclerotinia borealis F-4128]|uniref:Uncharacterized protein n=1 Tax=Sclerotinia borealis (strain F-4128) TaxID=1432307 RepID=W9CPC3_SCLBF|nr:hypothetical protein SBOR_3101 [Sclerotinia borealis F-4128]
MSSTEETTSSDASSVVPPWLAFLTKLGSGHSAQKMVSDIANILKDFLLSDSDNAAPETAKQIDNYTFYGSITRSHLNFVFQTIYELAALISYEDAKQEMLLRLIEELLKMPKRVLTGVDGQMVEEGPIYYDVHMEIKHDMWNARHVDEFELEYKTQDEYTQGCIEWINLSGFYARCIAAGLDDHDDDACKFPACDIPEALEPEYNYMPGIDTDFRVMMATQYIVIAGERAKKVMARWWEEHAPILEKKLEELEDGYENGFPDFVPVFEIPPGQKSLTGTGDLGMDLLGSVKAARMKLRELSDLGKERLEKVDVLDNNEEVAQKQESVENVEVPDSIEEVAHRRESVGMVDVSDSNEEVIQKKESVEKIDVSNNNEEVAQKKESVEKVDVSNSDEEVAQEKESVEMVESISNEEAAHTKDE